jgi:predicted enzyme related to lactoylglutathione lyase
MSKVVGIGGVFFKAKDPDALGRWYAEHLGLPLSPYGFAKLPWRRADAPDKQEITVWSPHKEDSTHFAPSTAPFMINYIVEDLDAALADLRAAGATVDDKIQDEGFGRFGWAMDPEGNRIELWQPTEPK